MFISSLRIGRFRQLQNVILHFSHSVEAIHGPNNSGKTTILMALKFVYYMLNLWVEEMQQGNTSSIELDSNCIQSAIGIPCSFLMQHGNLQLEVTLANQTNSSLTIVVKKEGLHLVGIITCDEKEQHSAVTHVQHFSICYLHSIPFAEYSEQYSSRCLQIQWYDIKGIVQYSRTIYHALNSDSKTVVLQQLQVFMPEIDSLTVKIKQSSETILVNVERKRDTDLEDEKVLDIAHFGTGQMNLFYLIVWMQYRKQETGNSLFCVLDEPIAYLSEDLMDKFIQLIAETDFQFIIATHSDAFIHHLEQLFSM